jgi:signal transduction histidine kinase
MGRIKFGEAEPKKEPPGRKDRAPQASKDSSLIRSARRIMLAMGVIVALMQIAQHFQYRNLELNLFLFGEVIFYVVVLPLMGSVLLNLIARSERQRSHIESLLTEQYALVRSLSGASEWSDLVQQVVEFPHFVLPVSNTSLYVYNEKTQAYDLAAYWGLGEQEQYDLSFTVDAVSDQACQKAGFDRFYLAGADPSAGQLYCLPLCLGDKQLGLLRMRLPLDLTPSQDQANVLDNISTDLALVLDRAMLRSKALSQAAASQADRRQIAQDLHDTLAQNIAYLRLKLEELLLEEDPRRQISLINRELTRMHATANEAYMEVRETLAELRSADGRDLFQMVLERVRALKERLGIELPVVQRGTPPAALEPFIKRQVIYICREALTNIEKHARPRRASLTILWEPDCLTIEIEDEGAGFDPQVVDEARHYGLMIMRERAASAGGELVIESHPGLGTTVSLRVPHPYAGASASNSRKSPDLPVSSGVEKEEKS